MLLQEAMLLTGMDNHNTGIPMIPEVLPWKYRDTPGYEGYLREDALTLAEILKGWLSDLYDW